MVQRKEKIAVVGAGQMGAGIAQTFLQFGYEVKLYDIDLSAVRRGCQAIEAALARLVAKNRLSPSQLVAASSRLYSTDRLTEVRDCTLVIEAAPERMEIKRAIFGELSRICQQDAVLATNTSSLSVTELASAVDRPGQVVGMHFMNPVPVMPLVELIRGLRTTNDTLDRAKRAAESIGKTAVEVSDFPGFVSNRVLMPMINEAIFAVYEGVASPEAVDRVMQLGMNHRMGPLALADHIGLDTCLFIMETLHSGFGDSKYRPCPLLRQYVAAGRLGKKTGEGFYHYSIDRTERSD
ncbi:3-hydroxybutyryl-CoA dehydrogenase [Paenibacillus sp. NPDC058071]|uniref:3-hydroxybutyryl-CoA dehydrogenase n=1 Tax=Paenibacillus sp. NPDC058071 TaxID=3346326 RepID=UPI0036D78781